MQTTNSLADLLSRAVNRERLLDTAVQLISVPSRTGEAGAALDQLASILRADGFIVERAAAGHPQAPAVIVRLDGAAPGPTLQFNGHLDTVHLPFVPPAVKDGLLTGSGAADMKGGTSAAVEALRVLRDTRVLSKGSVLFIGHDLHEAPWGFGQQLDELIRSGCHGDAVLLPEPLTDHLPVVGRGAATWKVTIRRAGAPTHEVMRPRDEPDVIAAGADLVERLGELQERLAGRSDPHAGSESVFIGQIHSGEIYNQYPQECWLEGTRRWLPPPASLGSLAPPDGAPPLASVSRSAVEGEFRALLDDLARETGTSVTAEFRFIRDAFRLDPADRLVASFQAAYRAMKGSPLPLGPKPFVDDGNAFYGLGPIPAITHGPRAGGQHTVKEWIDVDDMVRVAALYALAAVVYCTGRIPESEPT